MVLVVVNGLAHGPRIIALAGTVAGVGVATAVWTEHWCALAG